jgi:hypothetical protein
VVGEDHQAVVLRQRRRVQVGHLVRVRQGDPPGRQHRLQLPEPGRRLVVPVVAEEQHAQLRRLGGAQAGGTRLDAEDGGTKRQENSRHR